MRPTDTDFSLDQDYRNATKFNLLLQRLRSSNKIATVRGTTATSSTSSTSATDTTEEEEEEEYRYGISDIVFLHDPSTDDDSAAAALGDALQIQLQNVRSAVPRSHAEGRSNENHPCNLLNITRNHDTSNNNAMVEVVNHLDIVVQLLTNDFDKYQSLLQYLANAAQGHNPYLESVVINAIGDHVPRRRRRPGIQDPIVAKFCQALLPVLSSSSSSSSSQPPPPTPIGLQQLAIYGCDAFAIETFVAFLHQMTIPILEMDGLSFGGITPTPERAAALTKAFCQNTFLRDWYVEVNRRSLPWITAILQQLMSNTTIRILRFEWNLCAFDQHREGDVIVMEFLRALAKYLAVTQSLQQMEFIDFPFIDPDALRLLLTAISSNPSIQVLTFQKCTWDGTNWYHVLAPHFQYLRHLRRFEMNLRFGGRDLDENDRRMTFLMRNIIPSNIFLQQLCILPKYFPDGTIVLNRERKTLLRSYLDRNRGIQQFIQQYAKQTSHSATAPVTVHGPTPDANDPNDVTTPCMLEVQDYINHYAFHIYESLQMAMRKQRRQDHQYDNVQRYLQKRMTTSCVDDDDDDDDHIQSQKNNGSPHQEHHNIPIALLPTILSNHFQPSTNHYGPTIIYQILSNMGHKPIN